MRGMTKGFIKTMRHLTRPSFTGAYPWAPKVLPPRSRTSFVLPTGADGIPFCKSCGVCEKSCPDGAITIISEKRADRPGRVLLRFEIDLGVCMYCGLCVENCPSAGLAHAGDFELAVPSRNETVAVLYEAATDDAAAPPEGDEQS